MKALDTCLRNLRSEPDDISRVESASADAILRQAELAAEYERGVEDGLNRSRALVEQTLAASREEIAAVRSAWSRECADRISRECVDARALLENRIGDAIGAILAPFVADRHAESLRGEFLKEVRVLAGEYSSEQIAVSGPTEEMTCIVDILGAQEPAIRLIECQEARLVAEAGNSLVAVDVAKWAEAVRRVLGGLSDVRA